MVVINYFRTENAELRDVIELFFEEKNDKSKDTAETYYYAINSMSNEIFGVNVQNLKKEQIESLNWSVLNKYKAKLKETCSNTTVNNRMSGIKSLIRYLTARNVITYNIAELDLVELLNDDSESIEMIPLEILFDYCDYFENFEQRKGKEKRWICLLGLESGNRIQDLLSIRKSQFIKDGDDYILKSKGKNRGKGNKEYIKRIGTTLYDELMKLNPESDKVFSVSYNAMLNAFNRANEYFGNTEIKYTPHSIRHLVARLEYLDSNGDILAVKEKLNHDSIETTMRYLKIERVSRIGAYSRMLHTKTDKFKEANLDDLINVISDLPMDVQYLINKKLEDLSNTNYNLQ